MRKFLLGVIVGSYVAGNIGIAIGKFKMAYAWAVAHPEDPAAEKIVNNMTELKENWNKLKHIKMHAEFEDIMRKNDLA